MAYSEDYRKRVIEYRKEGHTYRQACEVFKVALITNHPIMVKEAEGRRDIKEKACKTFIHLENLTRKSLKNI